MKSQLKAGAVLSYIALFVNSAISILYTPIMLRLLGQSEYGLYGLATSSIGYIGVLNFGLGNALIRYVAKYKTLKDDESCSRLYGMFTIIYAILGTLALVIGVILTLNSYRMFSKSLSVEEISKLTILMGITTVDLSIGIGLGIFSVIMLAHEKFIAQKIISIVSSVLSPLVMLPILIMGYGSISIVITSSIISFLTILINVYYCLKVLKIKIKFRKVDPSLLKEIIIFSSFIFLNMIIDRIYWSTDQIILGIYCGTIAISIYTIGASFSGYFSGFSAALSNVFLSKVTSMIINEVSDKEISDLFIKIGRIQYVILSFTLSGFIVFGKEFIYLWVGKEYSTSFVIALLILIPMLIPLIQSLGGIILQAKNLQKFKSIVYFAIAIANVLISVIFVQWWGVIGCALGTAIAFTLGNIIIMNIYYWKRLNINIPIFWKNILFMSTPLIISIVFVMPVNKLIPSENWGVFLVKIMFFSFFYFVLMWFIGLNNYEKELFSGQIKNLYRRPRLFKGSNLVMNSKEN